ncbi:MAG: hypothetical protein R2757_04730 [Draconibacterium sp.]
MKTRLVLLFLFIFSLNAFSQEQGKEFIKNRVNIYNQSSEDITFLFGKNGNALDTIKIKSNRVWTSPPYESKPIIKIYSTNCAITYSLSLSNYYAIFWNENRKCWDVKRIRKKN